MTELTAKQITKMLMVNIKKDMSTMIHGAPGIGKSQVVHQVADELEMELIDIRLNLRESVDLRGLPLVDEKSGRTRWLPPAELPKTGKGILFLDEINSGVPLSLQAAAMGLVLDRKLGEYKLPKGWVPVGAGNRVFDKAATQRMGTALSNRFSHLEMKHSVDDWVSWAMTHGISHYITSYIRAKPDSLHRMPQHNEHAFPTPRSWEFANKYMDVQDKELRLNLISSVVGDGCSIELEGHIEMAAHLPDHDYVLTNPTRAPVPPMDQPSAMCMIGAALAHYTTSKNFKNALIYMARLPKEHEVAMVLDAITRDRSLTNTKAYGEWCVENQDVVVG